MIKKYLLCSLLFIFFSSSSLFAFDRQAVVRYADQWALSYNQAFYPYGEDCANFASQCMMAGNVRFDAAVQSYLDQYGYGTIPGVENLEYELENNHGIGSNLRTNYDGSDFPLPSLPIGDPIFEKRLLFVDWHSTINVGMYPQGENGEMVLCYDAHTNPRKHWPYEAFLPLLYPADYLVHYHIPHGPIIKYMKLYQKNKDTSEKIIHEYIYDNDYKPYEQRDDYYVNTYNGLSPTSLDLSNNSNVAKSGDIYIKIIFDSPINSNNYYARIFNQLSYSFVTIVWTNTHQTSDTWEGKLTIPTDVLDGIYTIEVNAYSTEGEQIDSNGNLSVYSSGPDTVHQFEIDTIPPKVLEINPREGSFINTKQPSFSVVLKEMGAGIDFLSFEIFIDGFQEEVDYYPSEQAISCTSSRILDEGEHTWQVVCKDMAGNVLDQSYIFTVDTKKPDIAVSGVINGKSYNHNVIPIINITDINLDGTASVIKLNNNNFISETILSITPGEIEGCNLNIYAKDLAGNEARKLVGFILGSETDEILNRKEFVVYELNVRFKNTMMITAKLIDKPEYKRIGAYKGDRIEFSADLKPDILFKDKQFIWSGEKAGTGATILVDFNNVGDREEKVDLGNISKTVSVKIIDEVPLPNRIIWGIQNLLYASKVKNLGNEAKKWANDNQELLGWNLHNGRADAARHSYWNVLMTIEIDAYISEGAATAYERTNYEEGREDSPYNEIAMDLENNAKGRFIGINLPGNSTREEFQNVIIDALNNGDLTVLDEINNDNEKGLLKPSDK